FCGHPCPQFRLATGMPTQRALKDACATRNETCQANSERLFHGARVFVKGSGRAREIAVPTPARRICRINPFELFTCFLHHADGLYRIQREIPPSGTTTGAASSFFA